MQIRIVGTANMKQVTAEFASLQAQVAALNAQMLQSTKIPGGVNPKGYQQLTSAVNEGSQAYRNALASTGRFHVEQLRINSATETYTDLLQKQKLSLRDLIKNQRIMKSAYREQLAIQNMVVRKTPSGVGDGRHTYDIAVPTMVSKEMDTINKRMGWYRAQLASASTQTVNWGKNTQWAGRQLMVGFTMPVAAFGAATGVMAYQVDKEMTRIEKVYDTAANGVTGSIGEMRAAEMELAQLRRDSFVLAANAANAYGASIQDTLSIQAELAATGLRGSELMLQTNEVMRIATLGEMEYTTALNASITAQSVFRLDALETADAFNYMNAVENATSLQLQDFAEALPIAAAPVKAFGGDIRELGVLLTAMKQNGIAATQGANAIKASMQRLLRPSAQVRKEFADLTGQDIVKLVEQGKSLTEIFQLIGDATERLDGKQEGKAFAGLFGTYQVTRMRAMVEGMRDLRDGTGQVSDAARAAQMDTVELAEAANSELNRWQQSASGRFKRSVELFKVQMAEMGQPFLEAAGSVVQFITKVADAFNGLPRILKKGLAVGAIVMAIVGPLVMLTGLFANFAGNIGKFASVVMGAFGRLNIMNKSQQAAALSAELASAGMLEEASAIEILTENIKLMTLASDEASRATRELILTTQGATPEAASNIVRGTPPTRRADVLPDSDTQAPNYTGGGKRAAGPLGDAVRAAQGAKEQSKWMKVSAASAGVFSAAMLTSAISSNKIADNIANIAMMAAGIAPMIAAMGSISIAGIKSSIGKLLLPMISTVRVATGKWLAQLILARGVVAKTGVLFGGIGKSLKGLLLNPLTLAAVAVAGVGYGAYKFWQHSKKAREEVMKTYDGAEELAEIYGYIASETEQVVNAEGELVESTSDRVNNFRNAFGDLTKRIKEARTDQEKFNVAMVAGLNVINSGGTAEQARLAVSDALMAAEGIVEGKKIALSFEAKMDFTNAQTVVNTGIQKALMAGEDSLRKWEASWGERVLNDLTSIEWKSPWADKSYISNEAKDAGQETGKAFSSAFSQALEIGDEARIGEVIRSTQNQLNAYQEKIEDARSRGNDKEVKAWQEIRNEMIKTFAQRMGVENVDELVESLGDTVYVTQLLGNNLDALSNKQKIKLFEDRKDLGFIENMSLLMARVGELGDRAAKGFKGMNTELSESELAAQQADEAMRAMIKTFKTIDFKGALQGAYSSTQDDIAGMLSDDFSDRMEASLDATRAEADRKIERNERLEEKENERFENRWERRNRAVEKHFDTRNQALEDAIDREKKIEELRQKMFDAEMKRISRLNEVANRKIDFNVALNTGNLDEAARIRNDATAAATEWTLGDAGDDARSKAERKIERLEGRKDKIKEAKDDRLQALKDREEAERKHLTKVQKMRADQLKRETDNDIKAQEKIWKSRRKHMDEAIRYFKSYIATNEADLKKHMDRTGQKYEQFGKSMKGNANGWSKVIGERLYAHVDEARNKMQSDINWEAMGQKTANKMLAGAVGMNWPQFRKWMITGDWPRDVSRKKAKERIRIREETARRGDPRTATQIRHEGGWIGTGGSSRKGYAKNAPMHRNEKMVLAEKGEFMVNKHSAAKYAPIIDSINRDTYGRNEGPQIGGAGIGFGGLMGGIIANMMRSTIGRAIEVQSENKIAAESFAADYIPGKAGKYGDATFTAEQLNNAAIIASVGSSMGMSQRDLIIGLMTAMQESNLRNLDWGDRDSVGLFQQRTSQGWGSIAEIMNPRYAATKFFEGLRGVENRGSMSLTAAAQAVQRSAYPNAYAKWENEARAILKSMEFVPGKGFVPGTGKHTHPTKGAGALTRGIHGNPPAIDIGLSSGHGIYAVRSGVISESKDLRGYEPRRVGPQDGYRSYGRYIVLNHDGGGSSLYAHLSQRYANAGQRVKAGAKIGLSGNTGNSHGAHLHFGTTGQSPYDFLSLSKGAQNIRFDNTIANLHKGEAVLTEDINKKFRQGVDNFANGGNSTYNVNVNVEGTNASADDIANKVLTALKRQEGRKPRPRRGS